MEKIVENCHISSIPVRKNDFSIFAFKYDKIIFALMNAYCMTFFLINF